MQDVYYVENLEQASALLKPVRLELLRLMDEPRSCPELATATESTPQKVYYHIKLLEKAGIVAKVDERRVGGIMEGLYQAAARSYWLSPQMVGQVGGQQRARDQMSLGYILQLTEDMQADVGRLANQVAVGQEVPSLGLSFQIELQDVEERDAFRQDLQVMFEALAEKYGLIDDDAPQAGDFFRVMVAVYPQPPRSE